MRKLYTPGENVVLNAISGEAGPTPIELVDEIVDSVADHCALFIADEAYRECVSIPIVKDIIEQDIIEHAVDIFLIRKRKNQSADGEGADVEGDGEAPEVRFLKDEEVTSLIQEFKSDHAYCPGLTFGMLSAFFSS